VWSRSGEHGRLGSLKVVSVLCDFGPSLFGYTLSLAMGFLVASLSLSQTHTHIKQN